MDKETFFIKELKNTGITKDLNDDCAWLSKLLYNGNTPNKNKQYIIAMDSFVQDIHFRLPNKINHYNQTSMKQYIDITKLNRYVVPHQWLSYENLAKKAFIVNISDIFSSGALPKYALLSICIPSYFTRDNIKEIIKGINQICRQYNIYIIGGDTICGDKLEFHITMIGKLIKNYIGRDSVKNGDYLAYTSNRNGNLGNSIKTLTRLIRYGATINKIPLNTIESLNPYMKFATPPLRDRFILKANRFLNACMDISDGLSSEIKRLESINNLHFLSFYNIQKQVYQSGEEYELLFSFNPNNLIKLQKIALLTRIKLHVIGKFGFYKPKHLHSIKWHN